MASKNQPASQSAKKKGLGEYFKGVRKELSKVVWPTKKELGAYMAVVIATCAVTALILWLVDAGFLAVVSKLIGVKLT